LNEVGAAMRPLPIRRFIRILHCGAILGLLWLAGCGTNTDFGRVRPTLVRDDIHAWVGQEAAIANGFPASMYNLTDEERLLRDLAYPLIAPPYDRPRWYSVLKEYGLTRVFRRGWWAYDRASYLRKALVVHRSTASRYSRLIDDIRNDVVRIGPFFEHARRVVDLDRRRQESMNFIADLNPLERANALARVSENTLTVAWVQRALGERCAAYRYALERLVVAEPESIAADAERAIVQLQAQIAANHIVPGLHYGVASAVVVPR
jgi:hypothetical protein